MVSALGGLILCDYPDSEYRFNIYIYDYCMKRGYTNTARELTREADIPQDSAPPINAKQGLLFESVPFFVFARFN